MRRTEVLQEIRRMRFEEAYAGCLMSAAPSITAPQQGFPTPPKADNPCVLKPDILLLTREKAAA